jgi:hypothetical protein
LPVYNAYPDTFGSIFGGAYVISRDWISSTISEEMADIPTAWVVTGGEIDKILDPMVASLAPKQHLYKLVIMNHLLVRRLGVKVENIPLKIPGLGSNLKVAGTSSNALGQLAVYAAFYIQRQLAKAHVLTIKHPFRPYVVPNRPLWLVPRGRIGLATSVTHTMTPPAGVCTTDTTIGYVRYMFRDGTFRFIGGGDRQPMDYIGFFQGAANYKPSDGPASLSDITPPIGKSLESPSQIANRILAANAFSANVNAAFAELVQPPNADLQQQQANQAGTPVAQPSVYDIVLAGVAMKPAQSDAIKVLKTAAETKKESLTDIKIYDTLLTSIVWDATQTATLNTLKTGAAAKAKAVAEAPAVVAAAGAVVGALVGAAARVVAGVAAVIPKNPPAKFAQPTAGVNAPQFTPNGFQVQGGDSSGGGKKKPAVAKGAVNLDNAPSWRQQGIIGNNINNWGFFRRYQTDEKQYKAGGWHSGVDLNISGVNPLDCLTPIAVELIEAKIGIFGSETPQRPRATHFECIKKLNDPTYHNVLFKEWLKDTSNSTPSHTVIKATAPAHAIPYDNYLALMEPANYAGIGGVIPPYRIVRGSPGIAAKPVKKSPAGLNVDVVGWYDLPEDKAAFLGLTGGRLRICLSYMHLSRFEEDPVGKNGVMGWSFGGALNTTCLAPGAVIGHTGNTGDSKSHHLHIEMGIIPAGKKTPGSDWSAYQAIQKLNTDYLQAQIVAAITGWLPSKEAYNRDSRLNAVADAAVRDRAASLLDAKQAALLKNLKAGATVADVIALMQRDSKFNINAKLQGGAATLKAFMSSAMPTNPLFFFSPQQLLAGYRSSGSGFNPRGSMGSSHAPLGASAAYDGNNLQWCTGVFGTKVDAKAAAKAQQAAAAAGKATAANPQNKQAEDDKLKKTLALSAAAAKEAEKEKARARGKPERVRRKFNANANRGRKPSPSTLAGAPGVSSADTAAGRKSDKGR